MKLISVAEIHKGDKIRSEREIPKDDLGTASAVEYIAASDGDTWFDGGTNYLMERPSKFPHETGTLIVIRGRMPLYRDYDNLWHYTNEVATQTYTDGQLEELFADYDFVVLWTQNKPEAPFGD